MADIDVFICAVSSIAFNRIFIILLFHIFGKCFYSYLIILKQIIFSKNVRIKVLPLFQIIDLSGIY